MPWLVPFVRQALAADTTLVGELSAAEPGGLLVHPNVDRVQETLLRGISRIRSGLSAPQQQLLDELTAISRENLPDAEVGHTLDREPAPVRGQIGRAGPMERGRRPHGGCAGVTSWPGWATTRRWLTRRGRPTIKPSHAIWKAAVWARHCAACAWQTAATWCCSIAAARPTPKQRCDEARKRFEDARAGLNQSAVLFQADVLLSLAGAATVAATEAAEYGPSDHAILTALELLDKAGLASRNHPLVAYAHESYAWSLADRWMIDKSREEFILAEHVRDDNIRHWDNDTARIHLFHNRHGRAIVERYRGNVEGARLEFDALLNDIRQALRDAETAGGPHRSAAVPAAICANGCTTHPNGAPTVNCTKGRPRRRPRSICARRAICISRRATKPRIRACAWPWFTSAPSPWFWPDARSRHVKSWLPRRMQGRNCGAPKKSAIGCCCRWPRPR